MPAYKSAPEQKNDDPLDSLCEITYFGEGVYFFSMYGRNEYGSDAPLTSFAFGRSLAKFKTENPNLQVAAITGGECKPPYGFWVSCEEKNKEMREGRN